MSDYFLTYLWTWMEYFSAILLFDAFSARKMERFRHWIIVTSLAFLEATLLNFAAITMPNYSKIVIGLVLLFSLHRFLYTSNRMFSFYISVIFYATICCVDNCWYTMLLLMSEAQDSVTPGEMVWQNLFMHSVIIAVCFLQAKARNGKLSQATNFRWYTIPAVLSLASVLLIFFFGNCFQQGQISIQPLCVCATFITVMQIAALLLISWMEQNANFREEAISLQAKSKAQQESIEALSAAYAQQRKLTHDFRAHLSTLDGMLMQQNRDINTIQTYILHDLQGGTTELEELQKKLADARQEFDRLLDLSLECDASFLDEKLKHTSEEIDSLQKQIDQLTASQQKAANPNLQLTASDFHITEYSDAIVARIIERIDIVSANEIKIEFIGGYTVTAPLRS